MKKNQNKHFAFLLKAFIPAFLALLPLLAAGGGASTAAKASPTEAKASELRRDAGVARLLQRQRGT